VSGWEVAFPLFGFSSLKFARTVLLSDGPGGNIEVVVSCIGMPMGIAIGYHRLVSGEGLLAGKIESSSWRSQGAKAFLFLTVLSLPIGLVGLLLEVAGSDPTSS